MTQKEKELLLKDLCSRLPYGVKCQFEDTIETIKEIWFCEDESWQVDGEKTSTCIHAVKPYLFPLSSMTAEQREEYHNLCSIGTDEYGDIIYFDTYESIDYLYKIHVDVRNLIPKGRAIDATNLNIY